MEKSEIKIEKLKTANIEFKTEEKVTGEQLPGEQVTADQVTQEQVTADQLSTGDLILLSTRKWYSDIIEIGDDCIYSHCGIILKDPTYIDPKLEGFYFLESGLEPFPDATDNQYHFGVQIVPFKKVIDEYVFEKEGSMFHRKLNCKRDKTFERNLCKAYQIVKNKPYNCNPLDWLEALLGFHYFDRKITSRFWCSALVAYIYVQLGLIDNSIDWSLITPKEWSSYSNSQILFLNGSNLEKEIPLL